MAQRHAEVGLRELAGIGALTTGVVVGARYAGVLAPVPLPVLLVVFLGGLGVAAALSRVDTSRPGRIEYRVAMHMFVTMAMTYVTGWGPVLAIGLAFCGAHNIWLDGRRATRPAAVWSVVVLAAGEVLVQLDLAPSELSKLQSHGLAVLMAVALMFMIRIIDGAAADRDEAASVMARSGERLKRILANSADAVLVTDKSGSIMFASDAIEAVTGFRSDELVSTQGLDVLVHPDDTRAAAESWAALAAGEVGEVRFDMRVRHRDGGEMRWQEITASDQTDDPYVNGIVINAHDVTDRKRVEAILAGEARVLEMVAWAEPLDIVLDAIERLVEAHVEGLTCEIDLYHSEGPSEPSPARSSCRVFAIELPQRGAAAGRLVVCGAGERELTSEQRLRIERLVSLAAVAIEQAWSRSELEHRAFHDELTGLPKRVILNDRLTHALARAERLGLAVGVLFLDLDRFKVVNDGLGHEAGDRLLVHVAQRLVDRLRTSDTVARLGGDEFVVLVEDVVSDDDLRGSVARIHEALAEPFDLDGHTVYVTASIGVAVARTMSDKDDVLRVADDAMYRAKQTGRGTVTYQAVLASSGGQARLSRIAELHRALERDELVVHYQPIVELPRREPVAVEALVRWSHPELGLLLPGEFIPLAEDTGLIVPLGRRVLEHALERVRRSSIGVAVNVSALQLADESFVSDLAALLDGFDPARLTLEITENVLIEDADAALQRLRELSALGVRLSLDDFGTGYSSIAYLSRMPISQIKIDRSFVVGIDERPEHKALVRGMLRMARALGLEVVAEGIETEAQLRELTRLGCRFAQGFLFSEARPWATARPALVAQAT